MKYKFLRLTIFYSLVIGLSSCLDYDISVPEDPYQIAIPLVNSRITIQKAADLIKTGNASMRFDADGKATALYKGEVIKQNAASIFPAYPGIFPFIIDDTVKRINLPLTNSYLIKNAVFKDTKIKFVFEHPTNQAIDIKMKIAEVSKGGQIFERTYNIPAGNSPVGLTTEEFSIDGWDFKSNSNAMTFSYTATLPSGERIKLNKAAMLFDFIKFKYIDGYLGYHLFGIDGSAIDVSLFKNWISGGFKFSDPKIAISVENAFGIPVRSKVNKMDLVTINGSNLKLESIYVENGFNFNYPNNTEIGQSKTSQFYFDKENSNIEDLFNEKITKIDYDVDAVVNPDKDTTKQGFITEDSYFVINVEVEVPLEGYVDAFTIRDTIDLSLDVPTEVKSVKLKVGTGNDFPADMLLSSVMLDNEGKILGNLFDQPVKLDAAPLGPDGIAVGTKENIHFFDYDSSKLELLKKTKQIIFTGTMSTIDAVNKKTIWVYKDYGIQLNIGAIFEYK